MLCIAFFVKLYKALQSFFVPRNALQLFSLKSFTVLYINRADPVKTYFSNFSKTYSALHKLKLSLQSVAGHFHTSNAKLYKAFYLCVIVCIPMQQPLTMPTLPSHWQFVKQG